MNFWNQSVDPCFLDFVFVLWFSRSIIWSIMLCEFYCGFWFSRIDLFICLTDLFMFNRFCCFNFLRNDLLIHVLCDFRSWLPIVICNPSCDTAHVCSSDPWCWSGVPCKSWIGVEPVRTQGDKSPDPTDLLDCSVKHCDTLRDSFWHCVTSLDVVF